LKTLFSPTRRVCLIGALLAASLPSIATAQVRTVLVPVVPGNPLASGLALVTALAAIPSPSAADPWVIQLEPGLYEIPTIPLQMRAGVSLVGSGVGATEIHGVPPSPYPGIDLGVVHGANDAELRDLTIEVDGTAGSRGVALQNLAVNGSFRIVDVRLNSSGSDVNCGLRNVNSAPTVRDVDIHVEGGTETYGVILTTNSLLNEFRRINVIASGATTNHAMWVGDASSLLEIRDSEFLARLGSDNYGILWDPTAANSAALLLTNVEIDAVNGSNTNTGLSTQEPGVVRLENSDVNAAGGITSQAIVRNSVPGSLQVSSSELSGTTNTVSSIGPVKLRTSGLKGGPIVGAPAICAGVWDEADIFYPSTCPP
jgi:hypothetical protein